MPMIPPPIMSALKIQVNHVIMDTVDTTAWTISSLPNNLTKAPLLMEKNAIDKVNGADGISKKMQEALANSNNSQKIELIQNGNVSFAKMIDRVNIAAYNAGGVSGFQSIQMETPDGAVTHWFSENDRKKFTSVSDCRQFGNNQVRDFTGNVDDDAQVRRYVAEMSNNKASWSTLLVEFSKAIERLIKKILIFISTITQKTSVAITAVMTLIKIMEECFDYTSSQFQTVITVGSPTTQTSIITT